MLHSEQKCAHFCSEWSIVGYGTYNVHSGICEIVQLMRKFWFITRVFKRVRICWVNQHLLQTTNFPTRWCQWKHGLDLSLRYGLGHGGEAALLHVPGLLSVESKIRWLVRYFGISTDNLGWCIMSIETMLQYELWQLIPQDSHVFCKTPSAVQWINPISWVVHQTTHGGKKTGSPESFIGCPNYSDSPLKDICFF